MKIADFSYKITPILRVKLPRMAILAVLRQDAAQTATRPTPKTLIILLEKSDFHLQLQKITGLFFGTHRSFSLSASPFLFPLIFSDQPSNRLHTNLNRLRHIRARRIIKPLLFPLLIPQNVQQTAGSRP